MKDKIKASHILIMHNESRDSRSDITKDKAKKKNIDLIYKSVVEGEITLVMQLSNILTVLLQRMAVT